jgi:hypothetical protein
VLYKVKVNGKHITTDKICMVLGRRWSLLDVGNADTLNEVTVRVKYKVLIMVNVTTVAL